MHRKSRVVIAASTDGEVNSPPQGTNKRKAEEELSKQPTKRAIASKGPLWMKSEMPLDNLWHEIFKYLEPYDLLRLARTAQAQQTILMCLHAKEIWHSSFAAIAGPFPPCPNDLNELKWANLMF
ncbi:hypothetical protein BKA70DRAFT_1176815 [Coprinopsis sp. MPI-PUGE-AT-0042]|nr:hypothetical protein BKA70DRAFT_1176815 [Coprinopsis sp. MPI-PUGE-AT-0042]